MVAISLAKEQKLSCATLQKLLHYDPITGAFTWLVSRGKVKKGTIAGWVNPDGYRIISIDDVSYAASRLAWFYMTGKWPVLQVDHENLDKDDNVWANLREATNGQNNANKANYSNNKSGFKGVSWHKSTGLWRAQIRVGGKKVHLCESKDPQIAYAAYCAAAAQHHQQFARLV